MPDNQEPARSFTKIVNRKPNQDLSNNVFGKIPPQARDLEEAVLGAMMLDKNAVSTVIDILKPESFYVDAHRSIYKSIMRLFEKSQPIDILTVTDELRNMGELEAAGGPYFVTELTNRIGSSANVEHHARIVSQKHIQRELIRISDQVIKDAYEDTTDVFELLDKAEQGLFSITDQNLRRNYASMSNLITAAIKQIEDLKDKEDGLTGIPSGFVDLDRVTSGWQKSDLVIIAARPGMGKTAFTLSMARNAAVDFHKPVAVFSLEMSNLQLVNRLISSETELPSEKLRKGSLQPFEWTQLTTKVTNLSEAPIFIDDTPGLNIFELRAKCRRLKMQHDVQLIVIDYLQLMSGSSADNKGGNREQEISNISRALKSIAKELDVPVIALSQLSRAVETRGGTKRPQLSDLRESGAIEQDADMVIFIYRPEYYDIREDAEGNSLDGMAELIIAKHRNGALKNVYTRFIDKFAKFTNLENSAFDDLPGNLKPLGQDAGHEQPGNTGGQQGGGGTITRGSRMNDITEDPDEDVPF